MKVNGLLICCRFGPVPDAPLWLFWLSWLFCSGWSSTTSASCSVSSVSSSAFSVYTSSSIEMSSPIDPSYSLAPPPFSGHQVSYVSWPTLLFFRFTTIKCHIPRRNDGRHTLFWLRSRSFLTASPFSPTMNSTLSLMLSSCSIRSIRAFTRRTSFCSFVPVSIKLSTKMHMSFLAAR